MQTIRRPFVLEFKDIFHGEPLEFDKQFKPEEKIFRGRLSEMKFSNSKSVTRTMLAWWLFHNDAQELPPPRINLHIEHIFAQNRNNFHPLENDAHLEFLGNKSLLEEGINIKASDNGFADKKIFYLGFTDAKGKSNEGTFNLELRELAETHNDFTEQDIIKRNEQIFDAFIEYLRDNNLLL